MIMSGNEDWNRNAFQRWRKVDRDGADITLSGSMFQMVGPATGNGKARPPTVDSFTDGTSRRSVRAERRERRPGRSTSYWSETRRYMHHLRPAARSPAHDVYESSHPWEQWRCTKCPTAMADERCGSWVVLVGQMLHCWRFCRRYCCWLLRWRSWIYCSSDSRLPSRFRSVAGYFDPPDTLSFRKLSWMTVPRLWSGLTLGLVLIGLDTVKLS